MGGSKLLNNKNVQKDAAGRIMIQKELSEVRPKCQNLLLYIMRVDIAIFHRLRKE